MLGSNPKGDRNSTSYTSASSAEKACREWGVDALEELQEDEADRVSLRVERQDGGVRCQTAKGALGPDWDHVLQKLV
jgi:hypothetical protein